MGYWNGYAGFYEWAEMNDYKIKCKHCGTSIIPKSGNQLYCSREDNPECDDDKYFKNQWIKGKHPLQPINKEDR